MRGIRQRQTGKLLWKRMERGVSAVLLILGILCFLSAANSFHHLEPFSKKISFVYTAPENTFSAEEIAEKQEKGGENMSAVWWQKRGIQEIQNKDTGRQAFAEVLAVCGRTDLLFAHGTVLDYDQTSFCLVGRKTAAALFGGRDVKGRMVICGDRAYEIAGVLTDAEDVFVYEAGREAGLFFERADFRCEDPAGQAIIKRKAEALFAPDAAMDYSLLYVAAHLILLTVPAGAGIRLIRLYRSYGRQSGLAGKLFWTAMCCLLVICFFKMASDKLYIPAEFFPSKWSDFTFWQKLWQQKRDGLALFFQIGLTSCDALFFKSFFQTIFWTIFSFFCFSQAERRLKGAGLWHRLY